MRATIGRRLSARAPARPIVRAPRRLAARIASRREGTRAWISIGFDADRFVEVLAR